MSSRVGIRSSRANGALSRGPKAAAGKLRAAGNRILLGLYSRRVVLKTESREEFDALLAKYNADLQPQNEVESNAVKQMIIARWRAFRAMATQTYVLNRSLDAVPPDIQDPFERTAEAWTLACQVPFFKNLADLECRFYAQYHRAYKRFLASRQGREASATHQNHKPQAISSRYQESAAAKSGNENLPSTRNTGFSLCLSGARLPAVFSTVYRWPALNDFRSLVPPDRNRRAMPGPFFRAVAPRQEQALVFCGMSAPVGTADHIRKTLVNLPGVT